MSDLLTDGLLGGLPTARLLVPVNVRGTSVRLCFHNANHTYGAAIQHCSLARCDEAGSLISGTAQDVTFYGRLSCTILPEQRIASDILRLDIKPGDWLAISVYCDEPASSFNTICPLQMQSRMGDHCLENFENYDLTTPAIRERRIELSAQMPLFSALEVDTDQRPAIIACLGDSITQQGYWYVPFLKRLYHNYPGQVCLLNCGIGGNRLRKDSEPQFEGTFGRALLQRVSEAAFLDLNATHAIVAIGVNDLVHAEHDDPEPPPSPEVMAQGYRELAVTLRNAGITTMAFTLYPSTLEFPLPSGQDLERRAYLEPFFHAYNQAIRTAGFDRVMELQPILGYKHQLGYRKGLAQPDDLHLNRQGGRLLADAIDANWFVSGSTGNAPPP